MADLMSPSIDPLSQMLGEISTKLDIVTKTQGEDRIASATYRTDVRKEIATLTAGVTDLKNRIDNTADDLAEIRPDVAEFRLLKAQGTGMWNFAKALWVACIALGAGGLGVIIHAFWPPKLP